MRKQIVQNREWGKQGKGCLNEFPGERFQLSICFMLIKFDFRLQETKR